jgi:steroid delta-isomerase-like uncharacterized protein
MAEQTMTAPEGLTHERAREIFQRAYDVLNEHDLDRIGEVFTEDVVFEDDAWPETLHGHAGMRELLESLWRAFPDFRFEIAAGPYLAEDGRSASLRARTTGTMTGPFDPPGFAPTGGRMTTEYGGFYELDGDRIARARVIVNMNDAASQLGAAPKPGSGGERLVVLMQRVAAAVIRRRG